MKATFKIEKTHGAPNPPLRNNAASQPSLVAIDWGTSNFRAFLLNGQGDLLQKKFARQGILRVFHSAFAKTLHKQIGDWLAQYPDIPVIMSGMIGSRQGWQEIPYLPCPVVMSDISRNIQPIRHTERQWIVPGLRIDYPDGRVDVMRGEETQIIGALSSNPEEAQLFCLPGTHSKWAAVENGKLTYFTTYMTGELFTLLAKHSILGKLMRNTKSDTDGFLRGIEWAERDSFLLSQLFQVRTQVLADKLNLDDVYSFLSGVLIGHEIRQVLASPLPVRKVTLIANPSIARLYAKALKKYDMHGVIKDVDQVTVRGLFKIATQAGIMVQA